MKFTSTIASLVLAFAAGSTSAAPFPGGNIELLDVSKPKGGNVEVMDLSKPKGGNIELLDVAQPKGGNVEVMDASKPQGGNIEVLGAFDGGFAKVCRDIMLTNRIVNGKPVYSVRAICPDWMDQNFKTALQLNRCLMNDFGHLKWANLGHFDDSCYDCKLLSATDDVKMACTCAVGAKGTIGTTFALNEGIRNQGGAMWCGTQIGTRVPA
ncbi:hypothetical protein CGCF415_v006854 [Colletotrichum fructicola]|uniref:Cyanovirin-N domain-containing protein n=1 Tax=Colletotrichum fructicola (strain Nara gc5) TaxID=1213859 RepID=L2FXT5_COLFN|nr:uncharacterized protein CGMCC3_g1725 [Colletotrichum fructicola]KAF4483986.1 hypothetical protein CGGC5_v008446 [Colletotrichum fructicola Nara gc5]KAI8292605.1 hypothetical protein K4K60_003434 [Colletotrichum sp. SAR11_57]KAE9582574.1 hypothetical protein CGMCC3_g1725 [Colletotrichum fructicola]KAF4431345.1 hypothetical protein CFRS1_v008876 [Colletotrichum fructicola]KAF4895829.1 hypothetical protein CGCFRS4_v005782 [Colletotrichum fructicola]